MGKNHHNGPAGHYYCDLPAETKEKFEKLMDDYGLERVNKMWRNEDVSVNWCKRDRDGVITFLVYPSYSPLHPTEHDSLEELDGALADEIESEEAMHYSYEAMHCIEEDEEEDQKERLALYERRQREAANPPKPGIYALAGGAQAAMEWFVGLAPEQQKLILKNSPDHLCRKGSAKVSRAFQIELVRRRDSQK